MWPDMSPGETSAHTFLSNARRKRRKKRRKGGRKCRGKSRRKNRGWGCRGRIKQSGKERGDRQRGKRIRNMMEPFPHMYTHSLSLSTRVCENLYTVKLNKSARFKKNQSSKHPLR